MQADGGELFLEITCLSGVIIPRDRGNSGNGRVFSQRGWPKEGKNLSISRTHASHCLHATGFLTRRREGDWQREYKSRS